MIYFFCGPPGCGKTFLVTKRLLEALLDSKNKKKVFSNYPVIYEKKPSMIKKLLNRLFKKNYQSTFYSSYPWKREYATMCMTDCIVGIDEAYRDYNSRDFKGFTKQEHEFFATNRHDGNDFYFIAQHPNRLDTILREMINTIVYIKKASFPWNRERALWFTATEYLQIEDMTKGEEGIWRQYRYIPDRKTKSSYDTHFFRSSGSFELPPTWHEMFIEFQKNQEQERQEQENKEDKSIITSLPAVQKDNEQSQIYF